MEVKEFIKGYSMERFFIYRLNVDHTFFQFIQQKVQSLDWVEKHLVELSQFMVLDFFFPEKSTMKVINDLFKVTTGRHRRRIVKEEYPEIFFTPPNWYKMDVDDKRESSFKSIFYPLSDPIPQELLKKYEMLITLDPYFLIDTGLYQNLIKMNYNLRLANPNDVKVLPWYWKELRKITTIIQEKMGGIKTEKKWLYEAIMNGSTHVELLYQLFMSAIYVRFFRKRKYEQREKMIKKKYPFLKYNGIEKDIVKYNKAWLKNDSKIFNVLSRTSPALITVGEFKLGVKILEECVDQLDLDDIDTALCYHNIGDTYRQAKKPRKLLIFMKKALEIWERRNSNEDQGLTWGYIAEAYHYLGNEDKRDYSIERSFELLKMENPNTDQYPKHYLHLANIAFRIDNINFQRKALEEGIDISMKNENHEYFIYFNQRLLDINMGKDPALAELEPGKIKQPEEFLTINNELNNFIPITWENLKSD